MAKLCKKGEIGRQNTKASARVNCNFEGDWLIELSDNKLPDNNLASKLDENRTFFNQSHSRKL